VGFYATSMNKVTVWVDEKFWTSCLMSASTGGRDSSGTAGVMCDASAGSLGVLHFLTGGCGDGMS